MRIFCAALSFVLLIAKSRSSDPSHDPSFPFEEFDRFETEPFFRANRVKILDVTPKPELLQPGYIFIGPLPRAHASLIGPQIFTQEGDLVWYGKFSTKSRAQNFGTCNYLGEQGSHLCWCETDFKALQGVRGRNRIFDNQYNQTGRDYHESGDLRFPNPHEFHPLPDGQSFLQSVYQLRRVNLEPYKGPNPGYIEDGCFQEVDIVTGDAIFTWCALDHIELWHTTVFLNIPENVVNHTGEAYGTGTLDDAWDYFHLNSVDKTSEGDYIISARHLNQVLKVAGQNNTKHSPGEIIWRLGGKFNSFKGNYEVDLSKQHHARIVNESADGVTLSIFNNQWTAHTEHLRISNAQVLYLDEKNMHVQVMRKYYQPEGWLSFAQGSAQVFRNGNIFVGWGTVPQATEFSYDGAVLQHFHIAPYNASGTIADNQQNYRAFKLPWIGKPKTDPKLVAYSMKCASGRNSPLTAYVSWNGATEVKYWRFSTSRWFKQGPWISAGIHPKTGFETRVNVTDYFGGLSTFRPYIKAEALDVNQRVLGKIISKTYVPNADTVVDCDKNACWVPATSIYDPTTSKSDQCPVPIGTLGFASLLGMVVLVCAIGILLVRCCLKRRPIWTTTAFSHEYTKIASEYSDEVS